jgi:serine/threonine protein phosphatase PrpC
VALTPQLMHDAFTSAYLMSNLQLKFSGNDAALTSGATAVTAVVTRDSSSSRRWLHLANVGDSAAILCTADPNNGMKWESQRLYQTHRTSTPSERARVVSSGGFILGGRLNGSLAVTRAFGNHSCASANEPQTEPETETEANMMKLPCQSEPEPQMSLVDSCGHASSMEGLSVLPATRSINLDTDGSTALFLVLCCDGVTDVMSDQEIVEVVNEGYNKLTRRAQKEQQQYEKQQELPPDGEDATAAGSEGAPMLRGVAGKLSRWLVHTALKRGSRDNCSAIILLF